MRERNDFVKISVLLSLLFVCFSAIGQELVVDSTKVIPIDEQKQEIEHSPRTASIYSAILPGLGQAYNKKYWKIPFIYAGFGAFGYFIGWNNGNYKEMKQAYSDFTDNDPDTKSYLNLEGAQYYDLTREPDITNFRTALTRQKDYYRRNRDLLVITTVLFYGLNIIDASVDAHFFNFDISEDLSMNWQPGMSYSNNQSVYSIHCSFSF